MGGTYGDEAGSGGGHRYGGTHGSSGGRYAADDGCVAKEEEAVPAPADPVDPVSMKCCRGDPEEDLADATQQYRDAVHDRDVRERYARCRESSSPDSGAHPGGAGGYMYDPDKRDLGEWTTPRAMLDEFERAEIPEIHMFSGATSRRQGWADFLRAAPGVRAGLDHHAGWGPDADVQAWEMLDLWWLVTTHGESAAAAAALPHTGTAPAPVPVDELRGISLYDLISGRRRPPKSHCHCRHFDVALLSGQQVAALQCLGEYRRILYVAMGRRGGGGPDYSFLGREVDACGCAYCVAAGPNRSFVHQTNKQQQQLILGWFWVGMMTSGVVASWGSQGQGICKPCQAHH